MQGERRRCRKSHLVRIRFEYATFANTPTCPSGHRMLFCSINSSTLRPSEVIYNWWNVLADSQALVENKSYWWRPMGELSHWICCCGADNGLPNPITVWTFTRTVLIWQNSQSPPRDSLSYSGVLSLKCLFELSQERFEVFICHLCKWKLACPNQAWLLEFSIHLTGIPAADFIGPCFTS